MMGRLSTKNLIKAALLNEIDENIDNFTDEIFPKEMLYNLFGEELCKRISEKYWKNEGDGDEGFAKEMYSIDDIRALIVGICADLRETEKKELEENKSMICKILGVTESEQVDLQVILAKIYSEKILDNYYEKKYLNLTEAQRNEREEKKNEESGFKRFKSLFSRKKEVGEDSLADDSSKGKKVKTVKDAKNELDTSRKVCKENRDGMRSKMSKEKQLLLKNDMKILECIAMSDRFKYDDPDEQPWATAEFLARDYAYFDLNNDSMLPIVDSDGITRMHKVYEIANDNGYVSFALAPVPPDPNPADIKILWRGTASSGAVSMDKEIGGAGYKTFVDNEPKFIESLNNILLDYEKSYCKDGQGFSVTTVGHSLGGAEAELSHWAINKAIYNSRNSSSDDKKIGIESIKKVSCVSVNSPRVNEDVVIEAAFYANENAKVSVGQHVKIFKVHGDAIQRAGDGNIGSGFTHKNSSVSYRTYDAGDGKGGAHFNHIYGCRDPNYTANTKTKIEISQGENLLELQKKLGVEDVNPREVYKNREANKAKLRTFREHAGQITTGREGQDTTELTFGARERAGAVVIGGNTDTPSNNSKRTLTNKNTNQ